MTTEIVGGNITSPEAKLHSRFVIFMDIDGVVGAELLRLQLPDNENFTPLQERHLKSIGKQVHTLANTYNTRVVLCTGRSVEETTIIAKEMREEMRDGPFLCENGTILVQDGEEINLLREDLQPTADFLGTTLSDYFKGHGQQIITKRTLATIQIPDNIKGDAVEVKCFIEELTKQANELAQFSELFKEGKIQAVASSEAIDFTVVGWDKGSGVREYIRRFEVYTNKKHAAAIGDSASDVPMMREAGYNAAIRNLKGELDPDLKTYLEEKEAASPGTTFSSQMPLTMGTMETLHQFTEMIKTGQAVLPKATRLGPAYPKIMGFYSNQIEEVPKSP